jgi:hypothetical protein
LRQSDGLHTLVHVPRGGSSGRLLAHPIDRTNVTHIMTSTRRLRRVESENQIWLVIPNHYAYRIKLENKILMNHAMPFFFVFCTFFFLGFIGRIFGRSQVRIKVRETTGEGVHREVVHAPRDTVRGGEWDWKGGRRERNPSRERVWKVKTRGI